MSRRVRRPVAALLGAALTLALAACSSGLPLAEVPAVPAAESRVALAADRRAAERAVESADGPLSVTEAGEYYLTLVAPTNTLLDDFDTAVATSDLTRLRDVAAELAEGYQLFADGLTSAEWPASAAVAAEALALELEAEVPAWQAVADAGTDQETAERLAELPPPGTAAQLLRSALDLDGVPEG